MSSLSVLPNEILILLFMELPLKDCGRLSITTSRFYALFKPEKLWQQRCIKWWKEGGFSRLWNLEELMKEVIQWSKKDWKWLSICLAQNETKNGLGWRVQNWTKAKQSALDIGEFKESELSGLGMRLYLAGDFTQDWCVAEFRKGKRHGQGIYKWKSGDRYEGSFASARLSGRGKKIFNDGRIYEGNFTSDHQNNEGKMTWPDGFTYQGLWRDGAPCGNIPFHICEKNEIDLNSTDQAASTHPIIKTAIQNGECTWYHVKGCTTPIPQVLTGDSTSIKTGDVYCQVCIDRCLVIQYKTSWFDASGQLQCSCSLKPNSCQAKSYKTNP